MSSTRRPSGPRAAAASAEVTIEALGGEGEGLARAGGQRLAVPGALPGERHRVRYRASPGTARAASIAVLQARPRAVPPCPHFGRCGGCVVQHVADDAVRAWKVRRVGDALARRGLDAPVVLAHESPLASRRRLRLAVARTRRGVVLGLRSRRSHETVELATCSVAAPSLVALFEPLRELAGALAATPTAVELTAYESGADVVLAGAATPTLAERERLAAWAAAADVARLSWRPDGGAPEPLSERRTPQLRWPGLTVAPPPGVFLQATAAGEAWLQREVAAALAESRAVVDLYAGVGTLTAAARASGRRVRAVDRESSALAALRAAAPDVATAGRDLERHPLAAAEFDACDAVVLDPPRRGAAAQVAEIARSPVERVVYVSCDPVSFARDVAVLVAAGFVLGEVRAADQFRYASEVELIAVLRRQKGP